MIELKGIIQFYDEGHKCVDVVVAEGEDHNYKRLRVGVDIKVNRGKILTFLAAKYGVKQGAVLWPRHIKAIDSDIATSLAP